MPRRVDTLSRRAAGEAACESQQPATQALLRLAEQGGIALHTMPVGCRRFTLPAAGRLTAPALVVIGCGREPAAVDRYPAAAAAVRWARVAMIHTPYGTQADYEAVGIAAAQHRTAVLIETSAALLPAWQAFVAAAQSGHIAGSGP
jgi:hypothetical protein